MTDGINHGVACCDEPDHDATDAAVYFMDRYIEVGSTCANCGGHATRTYEFLKAERL